MNNSTKNYVVDEAVRLQRIAGDVLARPFVNGKEMSELQYKELLGYICSFTETYMNAAGRRERPLTSDEMIQVLTSCIKWSLENFTTMKQL